MDHILLECCTSSSSFSFLFVTSYIFAGVPYAPDPEKRERDFHLGVTQKNEERGEEKIEEEKYTDKTRTMLI